MVERIKSDDAGADLAAWMTSSAKLEEEVFVGCKNAPLLYTLTEFVAVSVRTMDPLFLMAIQPVTLNLRII